MNNASNEAMWEDDPDDWTGESSSGIDKAVKIYQTTRTRATPKKKGRK